MPTPGRWPKLDALPFHQENDIPLPIQHRTTLFQAMRTLGMSRESVLRLCEEGKIEVHRLHPDLLWVISWPSLNAYRGELNRRQQETRFQGPAERVDIVLKSRSEESLSTLCDLVVKSLRRENVAANIVRKGTGSVTREDIEAAPNGATVMGFDVPVARELLTLADERDICVRQFHLAAAEITAAARCLTVRQRSNGGRRSVAPIAAKRALAGAQS